MTHEFRTPLNSIVSLAGMLLDQIDGPLNAEQEKQVVYIRRAAGHLSDLVSDLLDLSKIEAGKMAVRPREFHVPDLLNSLRDLARTLLPSHGQVACEWALPEDLPPLVSDEAKVTQILRNLLSNSIKFTEEGSIRISAGLTPNLDMYFEIADTGIGIPPEDLERIFELFAQVDHPVQRKFRGTGLGLPLSRHLAHLLGGMLTVRSTAGIGSVFTLTLPLRYSAAEPGRPALFG